jgi:hypothetical protein
MLNPSNRFAVRGVVAGYIPTPDRKYFVVRGRLWRLSNPALVSKDHARLVQELMNARRALREGVTPR